MNRAVPDVNGLAGAIAKLATDRRRYVVAISGFGGSGKSTVSGKLGQLLSAALIHVDDFIQADENGALEGYPHDWYSLENLTLMHLRSGDEVVARIYDWYSNTRVYERIALGQVVIVEGSAGALLSDEYRPYFDLTVWVDVTAEVAHSRGKHRDRVEQGVNHDRLWDGVWAPLELAWFRDHRPDLRADVLLPNVF